MNFTLEQIKAVMAKKNYIFFENKVAWNQNNIWVRKTIDSVPDTWEDEHYLQWFDENLVSHFIRSDCTTKPGLCMIQHPINEDGAFIMVPGQYRHAFKSGLHKGVYPCLVQNTPLPGYRDNNKDGKFDYDPATIEMAGLDAGIHCHHGSVYSHDYPVGPYSAGCFVTKIMDDYNIIQPIWYKGLNLCDSLTSTLLLDTDFN